MVLEAIPKTAGARPPTYGGPPIGTTFCNEPDDRDDMLTHLRDDVKRLASQARQASGASVPTYLRLLDQRREWIKGELDVEGMLAEPPKAPLGIPDDAYDLASLNVQPADEARLRYMGMLDLIDGTMAELWQRMLESDDLPE